MFSVVIPLYNKELSIKNTLLSVLNQSIGDFEVLIINDGSSDNSLKRVKEINDSRIRIINKLNGGVSSARNLGILESRFDWIAFLDGDDLWDKSHLEEVLKMMELFPDKSIYATSYRFSNEIVKSDSIDKSKIFVVENYFKQALNSYLVSSSSIIIRKDCFHVVGFFNEDLNRGEDLEMWCRLAKKFEFVKSCKKTVTYRLESENRSCDIVYNIRKSFLSKINLKDQDMSMEEKIYKKKLVKSSIVRFLKKGQLKNALIMIKKML
ncbi:glycosyltransferase family 2 protein [Myroides sp. C15-4]|uniref:glycosyltransferase family 2 protein n=1 Tax=Myroides sp. C15-4 TaxID=3400532 RepID=UPI003D2F78C5